MKRAALLMLTMTSLMLANTKSIYVDLDAQKIYAKENNKVVLEGRISSGRKGYETPNGIYPISEKKLKHKSNLYPRPHGGASMPYMMRLGNTPVALHQGDVPYYPDSHGCIRLTGDTARKLFAWADIGTVVTVEGQARHRASNIVKNTRFKKVKKNIRSSDTRFIRDDEYDNVGYYNDGADIVEVY